MSAIAAAEFKEVTKDYATGLLGMGTLRAVSQVSLRIESGEVFGLLGPNRAGKTTLVKILLSLCRPTNGRVHLFGRPLSERAVLARIGYLHENQAFPRYWTAQGLLEYYGALTLMAEPEVKQRVPQLLRRVGLADRAQEPIGRFSKGMIQRLGLAQALLNDPELLVLDEPTEGLDLEGRQLVHEVVCQQRQQGRSVLLVSHSLADVEHLCDRIAVLVHGRRVFLGTVTELTRRQDDGGIRSLEQALHNLYTSGEGRVVSGELYNPYQTTPVSNIPND